MMLLPYFHVRYEDRKRYLGFQSLALLQGRLTPRVFGLVMEWASMHQAELMLQPGSWRVNKPNWL